ncbi:MAG: alpha/beta fold hydrolase [Gemmataceae bacterium]
MHPLRFLRRRWKRIAILLVVLIVVANVLAARHSEAFLVYADSGDAVARPEHLTRWQKLGLLVNGVAVPRPENRSVPEIPFTMHRIPMGEEWLEAWHASAAEPRGIVVMFPGYASAKSSLLPESAVLRSLGFDVLLVDFRGAGGSSGKENTLGVREADDVAAAVAFANERWPGRRIVLFGRSMGAAAVLRAVGPLQVKADSLILECPFDRMLNTVKNRFRAMGVPSFPGAEMLVYWGGRRLGFDGFAHNPEEYADAVSLPTLILTGAADARATLEQVRSVHDRLRGPKRLLIIDGAGHEPLLGKSPAAWNGAVREFLHP